MRGPFFLDAGNARGHAFVAASPSPQRCFPTRTRKISTMFDKPRPTRRGLRCDHDIVQPSGLVAFPAVQHLRQKLFAILKMPVETAFAYAEVAGEQFDAHGFNSLGGKARERGANPIVGLQWRRFKRSCGSQGVLCVPRNDTGVPRARQVWGLLQICDRERRGENFGRIAKAREPVHAGFFAEPSELALGEAARGLLDLVYGVFFAEVTGEVFA